jgi:hypothetical protein
MSMRIIQLWYYALERGSKMRVMLLTAAVIMSLLGACASPSAPPEPTPKATPVPDVPTPSPQPEPTPPPVTVLAFEGSTEGFQTGHERLRFQGEIRNNSQDVLQDIEAVITVYSKNDKVQGFEFRRIDERTLLPGEISGYSVSMADYVNGVYADLSFEHSESGVLELTLGPDVPGVLWKPVLSAQEEENIQKKGWVVPSSASWCPESPCKPVPIES